MESDDFRTEKVISVGDVFADGDVHLAAAGVEIFGTPIIVITGAGAGFRGPAVLEDLEPASRTVGCGGVVDFAEVDYDWAVVRAADGFILATSIAVLLFGSCISEDLSVAMERR